MTPAQQLIYLVGEESESSAVVEFASVEQAKALLKRKKNAS